MRIIPYHHFFVNKTKNSHTKFNLPFSINRRTNLKSIVRVSVCSLKLRTRTEERKDREKSLLKYELEKFMLKINSLNLEIPLRAIKAY